MVDPLSDRKRRKQELALQHNHHNGPLITTPAAPAATTPTVLYYSICTYNYHNNYIFPAQPASNYHYYQSAQSPPHPLPDYLHPPIALPITFCPPPLNYNTTDSATAFHLFWPAAATLHPAQPITAVLPRHSSAPDFYPSLTESSVTSPALQALRHQNSGPASSFCSSNSNALFSTLLSASAKIDAARMSSDWNEFLYGRIKFPKAQQAPQQGHAAFGMRTGSCLNNKSGSCFNHWKALQTESTQGTIAVVDWERSNIYMFMQMDGVYFMNYLIERCDVEMFARNFKTRQVFSGEIKGQKLKSFNAPMEMVDMTGSGVRRSTNSWRSLGINDDSEDMEDLLREGGSFVRMVRGALFGIVCSLYEDPSQTSVEMESSSPWRSTGCNLDIVHITTPPWHIVKRDDCVFSVFQFSDQGWASEDILVG